MYREVRKMKYNKSYKEEVVKLFSEIGVKLAATQL